MSFRVARVAPPLVVATTGTALAEPAMDPDLAPRGAQIEAQAHLGVATSPFDVAALREAKGQALVLLATGRYALSASFSLELRAPLVFGSVAQPAGSYVDAAALGNPQIGARYRLTERRSDEAALTLSGAVELGAPLAGHDEMLKANRLLAIADGIEGRGHPEWFVPGVAPLTGSSALRWAKAPFSLEAELRVPLLVRISEANLPSSTASPQKLGFAAVVGVEARYHLSQRLSLASAAHLFLDLVPAVEHVRDVARVQDFERLSLHVHLGALALAVDLQTAVGGELGGSTVAGGLRAAANLR
jgi:hypothetical protein